MRSNVVKLTAGQVDIKLGEKDFVLRPSLRAMSQISRQYDGLANARKQLVDENFDTVVFILRLAINQNELADHGFRVADIGDLVYSNGITADLLVALIRYVAILGNGGRPLEDEDNGESSREGSDSGNVSASKSLRKSSSNLPQDG